VSRSSPTPADIPPRFDPGTVLPFQRVPVQLGRRFTQILVSVMSEVTAETFERNRMGLLVAIRHLSGVDQKSLATVMALDPTSVGQVVDDLENRGFVRRVGSRIDRRVKHVEITEAGLAYVEEMRPKVLAAQRKALACLSDAEVETLLDLMTRVVRANAAHDRPGGGRRVPTRRPRQPSNA
jgi:DNA-binding MarR family transcriptional regulator